MALTQWQLKPVATDTIASGDFIAFTDEGESGDPINKLTVDNLASFFAGTGISASSGVLSIDASQTGITSVGTIGTGTWQGTAIATAYIADNAVTLAKMAGGVDGNIISYDANGDPVAIATGNDGQVLTSAGAGQPPAFEDAAAGGASAGFAIAMALVF